MTTLESLRRSMGWVHTYLGIGLASILMAVFWTGSLAVFDKEIDQWMKPELRIAYDQHAALDPIILPFLDRQTIQPGSPIWISPATLRRPVVRIFYTDSSDENHKALLHPLTGQVLQETDSEGGEFFFHFHYMLHMPGVIGYYLVAIASLGMLVVLVSGVFIHRKIIKEIFTFRPHKKTRRALLDFHNLTSVLALPFYFIMPFSGLLIFIMVYFPWSLGLAFDGGVEQLNDELLGFEKAYIAAAGHPQPSNATFDRYLEQAQLIWQQQEGDKSSKADWIAVFNYADANEYLMVERFFTDKRVALGPDQLVFDLQTHEVIEQYQPLTIHAAANWIKGLHWIQFDHTVLRWLYFVAGLTGCAMIASGMLFWMNSRMSQWSKNKQNVIKALVTASISGIILASVFFLLVNRLLALHKVTYSVSASAIEEGSFFIMWLVSFFHAWRRAGKAWSEQCFMMAIMLVAAVFLNTYTTEHSPFYLLQQGVFSVVIMDALLLIAAAISTAIAIRLSRKVG